MAEAPRATDVSKMRIGQRTNLDVESYKMLLEQCRGKNSSLNISVKFQIDTDLRNFHLHVKKVDKLDLGFSVTLYNRKSRWK